MKHIYSITCAALLLVVLIAPGNAFGKKKRDSSSDEPEVGLLSECASACQSYAECPDACLELLLRKRKRAYYASRPRGYYPGRKRR